MLNLNTKVHSQYFYKTLVLFIGLICLIILGKHLLKTNRNSSSQVSTTEKFADRSSDILATTQLPINNLISNNTTVVTKERINTMLNKLPLQFESNGGQMDEQIKYISRSSDYNLFLTANKLIVALNSHKQMSTTTNKELLQLEMVGANSSASIKGIEQQSSKSNYFIGNDSKHWRTNIAHYGKVEYEDIYPGIDLLYYGSQRQLEYDFVVAPGANPNIVQMRFDGATDVKIDSDGDLLLTVDNQEIRQHRPIIYQEIAGQRHQINGGYVLKDENIVGFAIADYDASLPLILDPVLTYSSYLGGNGKDNGYDIALDSLGNIYITGFTTSTNFPVVNAFQNTINTGSDAFITKLNAAGNTLIYSTYFGGSGNENTDNSRNGGAIAVDSSGNAYIGGFTNSTDFPTMNPLQAVLNGNNDCFLVKLNPAGNSLQFSTYIGGASDDRSYGIAIDNSGNSYLVGITNSTNFPTAQPLQANFGGLYDAFVTKINATGSALIFSTFLGGAGEDIGRSISVDALNNVYVTGQAEANFPLLNSLQSFGGSFDIFLSKLAANGALLFSTYIGGSSSDLANDIVLDTSGNIYLGGQTQSSDFPTVNPFQPLFGGTNNDAVVVKVNASCTAVTYASYLGGDGIEEAYTIALDHNGNAFLAGITGSNNFPTLNPLQASKQGPFDSFVTEVDPNGNLLFSTYLGGNGHDEIRRIAVNGSGTIYCLGQTRSTDFPTINAYQSTCVSCANNIFDTFIATIGEQPVQPGKLAFSAATYSVNENGGNININVNRSDGSNGPVTIDYTITNGTATTGQDYIITSGTLTFANNEVSRSIPINIVNDNLREGDETLSLTLSNPTGGATLGSPINAVLTIVDDDPLPSLSINDVQVVEGDSGTAFAIFNITLTPASEQLVTVGVKTINNTAVSPSDYEQKLGQVSFPAGSTARTATIKINGDTISEADENFIVMLLNSTNATIAREQGFGTIINDDQTSCVDISNGLKAWYQMSGNVNDVLGMHNPSAINNINFVPGEVGQGVSLGNNGFIEIPDTEELHLQRFTIESWVKPLGPGSNNDLFGSKIFGKDLSMPVGNHAATLAINWGADAHFIFGFGTFDEGSEKIISTHAFPAGAFYHLAATYDGAVFKLYVNGQLEGQLALVKTITYDPTIPFCIGSTSASYRAAGFPRTFNGIIDELSIYDHALSGQEILTIANAGIVGKCTTSINAGSLQFNMASYSVNENAGTATVMVERVGGNNGSVSVDYTTVNNSAIAGSDYLAISGTLLFANGETSKPITVQILDDSIYEGDETIKLELSNPTGNAIFGNQHTINLTIVDNDLPPTISINDVQVLEGNSNTTVAIFNITLSSPSGQLITVGVKTADGSATAPNDYAARTAQVSFPAGSTARTATIQIVGDNLVETDEYFTVNLLNPTNATIADGQGVATIINDDQPTSPICGEIPTNGLISRYTMNSNNNDLLANNSPSVVNNISFVPGKIGNGVTFGTQGRIEIPESTSLEIQQATFMTWVKPNGIGPRDDIYGSVIMQKGISRPRGDVEASWSIYWNSNGKFAFTFGDYTVGADIIFSTDTFPAGQFYHVVATYDGTVAKLYVDGVLEAQSLKSKSIFYDSAIPYVIGSTNTTFWLPGGYERTFNGVIDDFSIYNHALSEQEIVNVYNLCTPPPVCAQTPNGQKAYYGMNGTSK